MSELKKVNEPKVWYELQEYRGGEWQWMADFDTRDEAEAEMAFEKSYADVPYRVVEVKGRIIWKRM